METVRPSRRSLLAGFAIGAVTAVITGGGVAVAANPDLVSILNDFLNVRIVNDAPIPTSAQGTTQVAGTVSIGGTPTFNVGHLPSRTAFRKYVEVVDTTYIVDAAHPIPAGYRLVIDYINSYSAGNTSPLALMVTEDTESGPSVTRYFFGYRDGYIDSSPRIIVNAGDTLSAAEGSPSEPLIAISGHLEPVR